MVLLDISILLAEDNVEIHETIASFLKKFSFSNIYTAYNGKEALALFHEYQPDIILSDLNMPLMDGLELSRMIKKIKSDIPIILTTTKFEKEVMQDAVDIGIDAYLFKPISLYRLEVLIEKYIEQTLQKRAFLTEHKLLEEYRGAIDVSAAVTKTDQKGVITYVNDSFCLMTGYTKKELLGKRHNIVKHPGTPKSLYIDLWNTITSKRVWKGKIHNLKKDGSTYRESAVIVPIVNDKGAIVEFIAIRQDITDLYDQEQFLKKRIEEEVNKNIKETKFSIIGKMAAGITHEINTPLTYVRGNVELMLQDITNLDDDIKQKAYLLEDANVVLEGVSRIASIVESMREMASQSKELPQANNVYASLVTALTLAFNKAKFITQIKIQNEVFSIGMDKAKLMYCALIQKQRIEQVWVIIINNALDALKHIDVFDERLLEIDIQESDEFIIVSFKDNAGGIDEKILPKIFDPFESGKEEGGIGIGLNVAKRILEDHHGKIVASNYENGALFKVYLPKVAGIFCES